METLEQKTVRILREKNMTVATAESCTGGLLSARITAVPGSSGIFDGTVVSYANRIKNSLLGVPASVLEQEGAVSEPCAKAMADGVRALIGADIGVSLTGIAGPDGGSKDKPVGTVFLGISTRHGTGCQLLHLHGTRDQIREQSVEHALRAVIEAADAL